MLSFEWLDTEQNFIHQQVLMDAKKLEKEDLLKLFDTVHKQSLIRNRLFSGLVKHCVRTGVTLPSFDTLLAPQEIKRNPVST